MPYSKTNLWQHALPILTRVNISNEDYARTIELPDGELAGTKYNPELHPAQICILRAIDQGASWVALCKPVQDGGSLASFIPILRRSHKMGQTSIIAYPTMDSAKDAWTKKTWPMLERQGGTQPTKGGGSRGGAARVVNLPGGGSIILRAAGGRQESGQASVTADAMLVDEVDDWADMRVLRLIERRLSRSRDPLLIYVSTVKRDEADGVDRSRIVRLYEQGTQSRLQYPCPDCGNHFAFEWELVNVDEATMSCPHCGVILTDTERVAMLRKWRRVDKHPERKNKFSLMWTALESPFSMLIDGQRLPVMRALCDEYLAAKEMADGQNDHSLLRQFFRDRLCRPYRGDSIADEDGNTVHPTLARLSALSDISDFRITDDIKEDDGESRHLCDVPSWVEFLVAGVDVQRGTDRAPGRLYWGVYGRGGSRGAVCGWGTLPVAPRGSLPTVTELHNGLSKLDGILRSWERPAPLVKFGVDVGDRQDDLVSFTKTRREWFAVKGTRLLAANKPGDMPGWMYPRTQPSNFVLYLIPTHDVIRTLHAELLSQHGKPGSLALPYGLNRTTTLLRHFCGTIEYAPGKWSEKAEDRKHHPEWGKRIDYLHCFAYARALAYHHENKKAGPRRRYGAVGEL